MRRRRDHRRLARRASAAGVGDHRGAARRAAHQAARAQCGDALLRGSLVAVFDAEDLPEPNQLRDAAALFAAADETLACLQASLFIHNHRRSWASAMFCIDYAVLFDVFNKGASAVGLPFFLGGSSNHFRGIG